MASASDSLPYEPSLFELTLGILLSLSLGGLLACVSLAARPVQTVRELPKEQVQGAVYYVQGSSDTQAGRMWQRKRQALVDKDPGQIEFIEDELNAWSRAVFKDAPVGKDESSMLPRLKLGTPNFRIGEGQLQIAFESELMVYGTTQKVVIQTMGDIEPKGDGFVYVPSDCWIGGLHASRLPFAGDMFANRLLGAQELPEELVTAWKSLSGVEVNSQQVVLKMQ